MNPTCRVEIFADTEKLALAAADTFQRHALAAVEARGSFAVALAGGATPRALYGRLTRPPYRQGIPWSDCVVSIGDERHVPPDHAESNYRMVRETLLARLPAAPRAVCRFRAEGADPAAVVADYEADLRRVFRLGPGQFPRFDLVLLAHTASLFPGSPALLEHRRLAAAPRVESKGGAYRFTLTPPVLNAAATVLFLVTGARKARAVRDVVEGEHDPRVRPAQIVRPHHGTLVWMLDRPAARLLSEPRRRD